MIDNLRIQDIVARTAGTSLRDTVKCLRALSSTARVLGEERLAAELDAVLLNSAQVNGHIARLQEHPGIMNSRACDEASDLIKQHYSRPTREAAFRLLDCPFESAKVEAYLSKAS